MTAGGIAAGATDAVTPMPCAICGPGAPCRQRYPQRLNTSAISFEARKLPAGNHFRYTQCASCGLIFANPVFPPWRMAQLYRDAPFVRGPQVDNMVADYLDQFRRVAGLLPPAARVLEIGCGDGSFLKALKASGFEDVHGVEPGRAAVARADPDLAGRIVNDVFRENMFTPASFDAVCIFQTLDHVTDPNAVLAGAWRVLKRGGVLLAVGHDVRFWLTRLLGERSPMFDVEHVYLFDRRTLRRLLERNAFEVLEVRDVSSRYTVEHCLKMFPMPRRVKSPLLTLSGRLGVGGRRLRLAAGNMAAVARKGAPGRGGGR